MFQVEMVGYWVWFSTNINSTSLIDHCLLYRHCTKLLEIERRSCLIGLHHWIPIAKIGYFLKIHSGYFRRAADRQLLTGAIPLLSHTQTLGCPFRPALDNLILLGSPERSMLMQALVRTTWTNSQQKSHSQAIQQILPPSSWITRALFSSSNLSQKQN